MIQQFLEEQCLRTPLQIRLEEANQQWVIAMKKGPPTIDFFSTKNRGESELNHGFRTREWGFLSAISSHACSTSVSIYACAHTLECNWMWWVRQKKPNRWISLRFRSIMRLYTPTTLTPRPSAVISTLQNSTVNPVRTSLAPTRVSISNSTSFRQYISRAALVKPIRGKELFVRSIRRIIEQIHDKKQRTNNDQQIFSTLEETMSIFQELTFMKCMQLKKRLLDTNYQRWTIEFAREGGLHALLTYLEHVTSQGLSLVDAILVNEVLQCLRAMMNITELFEHIAASPQYIDSIAKGSARSSTWSDEQCACSLLALRVPSAEIRMRVFELLTALCVYSTDGYELVLQALQDFQVENFCSISIAWLCQRYLSALSDDWEGRLKCSVCVCVTWD